MDSLDMDWFSSARAKFLRQRVPMKEIKPSQLWCACLFIVAHKWQMHPVPLTWNLIEGPVEEDCLLRFSLFLSGSIQLPASVHDTAAAVGRSSGTIMFAELPAA